MNSEFPFRLHIHSRIFRVIGACLTLAFLTGLWAPSISAAGGCFVGVRSLFSAQDLVLKPKPELLDILKKTHRPQQKGARESKTAHELLDLIKINGDKEGRTLSSYFLIKQKAPNVKKNKKKELPFRVFSVDEVRARLPGIDKDGKATILVKLIHFMQHNAANMNSDNQFTILGNARAFQADPEAAKAFPPIRVFFAKGSDGKPQIWTLDHRRLAALALGGVPYAKVIVVGPEIAHSESYKLSNPTDGKTMAIKLPNDLMLIISNGSDGKPSGPRLVTKYGEKPQGGDR